MTMNLTEKQELECRTLWRNCFGDSELYMDYYFGEKCKESKIFVDVEDGHIVSMVYLNPYDLMWQGEKIRSYYIVGVATEDKYRKQGRMRRLLEKAFVEMKAEGILFTYLMPANRNIYEPFGFETIYRQKRIRVSGIEGERISNVKAVKREKINSVISMRRMSELGEAELERMVSFSQRKLPNEFDLYAVRDIGYYQQLQREMQAMEGDVAVFETSTGEMVGVVAYGLENGYLEVVESLMKTEFTMGIIGELLAAEGVKDASQIYFYETHFVDKAVLEEMGTGLECTEKEAIMVKVLAESDLCQELFVNSNVYLNELV